MAILRSAIAIVAIAAVLFKNRMRPQWRTPQFHWREAMPVWWSIFWRAALYGVVGGHFIGDAARVIAIATGHWDAASTSGRIAGWLAACLFSIVAVKEALQLRRGRLSGAAGASRAQVRSEPGVRCDAGTQIP
jgi:hypothetical protein